jgi:hypothetical protein
MQLDANDRFVDKIGHTINIVASIVILTSKFFDEKSMTRRDNFSSNIPH